MSEEEEKKGAKGRKQQLNRLVGNKRSRISMKIIKMLMSLLTREVTARRTKRAKRVTQ